MSFSKGDVVLLAYPFTDLKTTKVRPAVVTSPDSGRYSDVFVVPLTSRVGVLQNGEFILADWSQAGLNVVSAVKRGCVLVNIGLIRVKVGVLSHNDMICLNDSLRLWFDL
jgi:mRNA interferase MazF